MYVNSLNNSGVFSGWQIFNGDQAETHSLAVSESGNKVGLVMIGGLGQDGDVNYYESADGGVTWTGPTNVFTHLDSTSGDIFGPIRGVYMTFYGEEPCVVFEAGWQTTAGTYYPGLPSQIRFWSPNLFGGNSTIIADSSNVPYYANYGVADVQWPISRPVISHAQAPHNNYLFVAFDATNGEYWPEGTGSTDSTAYMRGMFMWSEDGGETWSTPEQFTPPDLFYDWRYPSIVPVCPVISTPGSNDIISVHMVMQGDTIPGSTVNGWGIMPPLVSAQYYHFSTEIEVVSNNDEIIANDFNLDQNYPNPFNPNTTINYSLGERSQVTLKVYDVLGSEVATLVNTTQEAGKHNVTFDASKLASGLYIYTLNAGSYTSSKKMMLLK
jgi:hypothetical protein